jgi:hypothetical protein
MSLVGFMRSQWHRVARSWLKSKLCNEPLIGDLDRTGWERSLKDPNGFYLDCLRYFHQRLPAEVQAHRAYFQSNGRGFGEDAFHVMWHLLLQEFRPQNFLEIGVFRGQVVSLVALWAKLNSRACQVCGISPFSPAGDAVSKYRQDVDYYQDTLANFEHFGLPHQTLVRAYSSDSVAVQFIESKTWDMIYIDGNHDYEVAQKDWVVCSQQLKKGGVIVLDDAGLTSAYKPLKCVASGGHPGPSRLAQEIDRNRFCEVLQVGHNRVFQKIS